MVGVDCFAFPSVTMRYYSEIRDNFGLTKASYGITCPSSILGCQIATLKSKSACQAPKRAG